MKRLQEDTHGRFVDQLMAHFAPLWPEKVKVLGEAYRDWIEQAVQAAAGFGIETQQLVARFVNLWFVWGRDFETQAGFEWAKEILTDKERSAFIKVHQLSHRTRMELETHEAERNSGASRV